MSDVKLKPCPFCGGECYIERMGTGRVSMQYQCGECGCSLETGETWLDEEITIHTLPDGNILNIDYEKGTPSTALGPLMGMEPTSLSRILKTMEDKGAISREKNPSDGRGVIIKLTDFGKEMREISKESVIIFNDIIKQHVTAEELEAFFKVTSTINKLITDKLIYKEDTINKAV